LLDHDDAMRIAPRSGTDSRLDFDCWPGKAGVIVRDANLPPEIEIALGQ